MIYYVNIFLSLAAKDGGRFFAAFRLTIRGCATFSFCADQSEAGAKRKCAAGQAGTPAQRTAAVVRSKLAFFATNYYL